MSKTVIQLLGGDLRQPALASRLSAAGYRVLMSGIDPTLPEVRSAFPGLSADGDPFVFSKNADVYLLPLPVSVTGTELNCPLSSKTASAMPLCGLAQELPAKATVLGGLVSPFVAALFKEHNHPIRDYYARESVQIRNALPTAEGAVELAMREMPITLCGSSSVVLGFGRIGKILGLMLQKLGSHVTVVARSPSERSLAAALGLKSADFGEFFANHGEPDVIFNTVPAKLLKEEFLAKLPRGVLLTDLASVSVCDPQAAEHAGVRYVSARSLPGKLSPVTAGQILADEVLLMLNEKEIKP